MRRCIFLSCGLGRQTSQLSHGIGRIFPGTAFGSPGLVPVPAIKDPNLGKLELRLLFFSSLLFTSFAKTFESCLHHVAEAHHK
jgi:hypothetical protein